jgi:hypothetical protein
MKYLLPLLALLAGPALAEPPAIVSAIATATGVTWRFDVSLRHPDTGWDHYADSWEVLSPKGERLGLRVLAHPHENEQPFTRSLAGVAVPQGTDYVMIRARCLVDGWADTPVQVNLHRISAANSNGA